MIYDRLDRLGSYRGLSKNLDEYETKEATEARYEAHLRCIDTQLVLEGRESCHFAPLEELEPAEPFSVEKDVGFFLEPVGGGCSLSLRPGLFALFFPRDAHKPGCVLEGGDRVRKIVIKVAV